MQFTEYVIPDMKIESARASNLPVNGDPNYAERNGLFRNIFLKSRHPEQDRMHLDRTHLLVILAITGRKYAKSLIGMYWTDSLQTNPATLLSAYLK